VQVENKLLNTYESPDAVFITRASKEGHARSTAVDRLRRRCGISVNRLGYGVLTYCGYASAPTWDDCQGTA
jgi:hypothetical protein